MNPKKTTQKNTDKGSTLTIRLDEKETEHLDKIKNSTGINSGSKLYPYLLEVYDKSLDLIQEVRDEKEKTKKYKKIIENYKMSLNNLLSIN